MIAIVMQFDGSLSEGVKLIAGETGEM